MDDRILLDFTEGFTRDSLEKRIICEHVKDHKDVQYLHLDYGLKNELLVVQCDECANACYNNCDTILSNSHVVISDEELSKIFSMYYILWKIEKKNSEDVILVCHHDAGVLEEVYKEKINECS
jgi:hypothetical protein